MKLRNVFGAAILTVTLGLVAQAAFAGDMLHFKAGDVDSAAHAASREGQVRKSGKAHYIVQFKSAVKAEDRQNLQTLGAEIVRYVPDDALIIKAGRQTAVTIQRSSFAVGAVFPMEGSWKTSNDFTPASVFTRNERQEISVLLFPNEKVSQVLAQMQKWSGTEIISSSDRTIIALVMRPRVEEIAALDAVEWVEPNQHIELLHFDGFDTVVSEPQPVEGDYTDLTGMESGTKVMNIDAAWSRGFTGKNQIASMADTGLDSGDAATVHQDFTGRIPAGFFFGLWAKNWSDPMGHGTHVAGSVTSSGVASGGRLKGGAYEAQFVPEGMWSPMLGGLSVPSSLANLFGKAYDSGARVHTNSWGAPNSLGNYDAMAQQADEFIASHPDMLILFAAGNSGVDADRDRRVDPGSVSSPGTAKNVLTVGASKNLVLKGGLQLKLSETKLKDSWPVEPLASSMLSETEKGLAPFSSRGPAKDGRLKPEIVAPGTNILSVRSQDPKAEPLWGVYNKDYVWSGGTSMATPLTAGAATVLRQYLIEARNMKDPSAALMKAVLMHTAFDLFPGQFGSIGKSNGQELLTTRPNNDEGYGRVDMDKATDLGGAILIDEKTGLATGDSHAYPIAVRGASHLVATLVYTDAAATAGAAKALVNDLDLVLFEKATGKETSLGDHTNNSEMLQSDLKAGSYEIRVKGGSVPLGPKGGKQPYALLFSVE